MPTFTPTYPGGWKDLPDTSTPITAAALANIETGLIAADAAINAMLSKVGATPLAGYALINGTGVVTGCSWTAPADGQMHRVLVFATLNVTVAETGGAVQLQYTDPGGTVNNTTVEAAAQGTGPTAGTVKAVLVQPGSTVTLRQTGALTAGAATLWAELWAS